MSDRTRTKDNMPDDDACASGDGMSAIPAYFDRDGITIYNGDCRTVLASLPSESVHCCVTSPPYWGLRDYGTASWEGGDAECDHKPPDDAPNGNKGQPVVHAGRHNGDCGKCGARRIDSQLGLESTPAEYVEQMVEVFREVRRVLRDDATLWLNLGDSYASGKGTCYNPGGGENSMGQYRKAEGAHPLDRGNKSTLASSGLKPKDLVGIPWRVAFALQADGWWLRQDIIWHKCLSGGTRVYAKTQKGEMPTTIKDLVRLDPATVKLWNGKRWTQAVSWSETKRNGDEVELVLRSGERIGCTGSHVWPTARGNVRTGDLAVGDVIQTCRLPEPDRPRRPDYIPDNIGWFIGLYIAEGSMSDGTIQIASHAEQTDRFHRLKTLADMFDGYCFVANTGGKSATANINSPILAGILDAYISGRTAKDKHLDVRCWKRSDDFLRSVLDGYLSGDGHNAGDRWRLGFCANDNLAGDLRTICARLGLSLRLKRTFHTCTNSKGGPRRFPGWRGEIRDTHRESGGEIVAIEKSRARKFWDIAVEDDPHLFALASGVLTHNSNPMPESVTDRCTKAHEYLFLLTKSAKYHCDMDAIKERLQTEPHAPGNRADADAGHLRNDVGRNRRSVWTIPTQPYAGAHFATFPQALVEPCIKAGCPDGGTVLDPFLGSGTTAEVARRQNCRCIGIELNPQYAELAAKRFQQRSLFSDRDQTNK